jgi:hypothetical protein
LCIMGIAITFAAIGMNYFKEYLGVIAKWNKKVSLY